MTRLWSAGQDAMVWPWQEIGVRGQYSLTGLVSTTSLSTLVIDDPIVTDTLITLLGASSGALSIDPSA